MFHSNRTTRTLRASIVTVLCTALLTTGAMASSFAVLHTFTGRDGGEPHASVTFDAAGNLYGTTYWGGVYGTGTVYEMTLNPDGSWTHKVLHSFGGANNRGEWPSSTPILDAAGNLYATTYIGDAYGCGNVFKLVRNANGRWTERVLHVFTGGADGCNSSEHGELIFDVAGNLYGATDSGGIFGYGVVFMLRPNANGSWSERRLHSFSGGTDGINPRASLVFDKAGNLYGTTRAGGAHDKGIVFKLTPKPHGPWAEKVLHEFAGNPAAGPLAGLIFDEAGNLYGTTEYGGPADAGTVFTLTRNPTGSWKFRTLHIFMGTDGTRPYAPLVFDRLGNLYGTTVLGGRFDSGTVFKLTQNADGSWAEQILYDFNYTTDGAVPEGRLIFDQAGNIYGTANYGGDLDCSFGGPGCGVVFKITP